MPLATDTGHTSRHPRWLRHWRGLLLLAMALGGAGAVAQVAGPTPAPTYCYGNNADPQICRPTLDQAEAAMRADPLLKGAGDVVEHFATTPMSADTLRQQYAIMDRRAESIGVPAYFGDFGAFGNSNGDCTLGEDQTGLPGWCASESQVVELGKAAVRRQFPECIPGSADLVGEYSLPTLNPVAGTSRGRISYGQRRYRANMICVDGAYTKDFYVLKQRPAYCRTGFKTISGAVIDELLTQDFLCTALEDRVVYISAPIQQCGSCAGSPNPIHPATGEKRRAEADFEFAGQTFVRHYRSLRQFRNNRQFAVAWTHTWSDRILAGTSSTVPYLHIGEAGDYEGYRALGGNRHRGENSTDRILERVNANGIGWRLSMPDGELREFDTDGYLIAVRHPDDPLADVSIAYVDKSISTVTDAQGRRLRFEYAGRLLRRIVLPDDTAFAYGYDDKLNLVTVAQPGGTVRQYHYNEPGLANIELAGATDRRHHLTGITAEDGRRYASFAYDARGRVVSSRVLGSPNDVATVSYPDEDHATLQTADGGSDAYTIQPGTYRRILGNSDGDRASQLSYDAEGRLARVVDKAGSVTDYAYDSASLTAITEAAGTDEERRNEIDRDPVTATTTALRVRDKTGALVASTTWTYNARRQTTRESTIDPATGASRATDIAYCDALDATCPVVGLLKSIDGPLPGATDIVRFEYRMSDAPGCANTPVICTYRKGDLWKTIDALGHTTEILASDAMGRVLSMRDANGVETDLVRDARGRPIAIKVRGTDNGSETDDQLTWIDYHPTGTVRRMVLADGVQTRFEYDAAQRLTRIVDGAGNTLDFTLNPAGDVVGEHTRDSAGALLRTLSRTYDTLGRLQAVKDAELRATTFAYDAVDNLTLETDALGRRTTHDHDALGRLRSSLQDVDGLAARTQLHYDTLDRVVRVTDPNGLHTDTVYNGFGDVVSTTSPDTGTTTSTYDAAGRVHSVTDARGITTTYGYDALDRVTSVTYPDNSRDMSFVYDVAPAECPATERFHVGRLARMTDASGATAFCYDRFGHLTRKLQATQGRTFAVRYDYTPRAGSGNGVLLRPRPPAGHLMGLTYPDGAQVRIDRNQLREITTLIVTLADGRTETLLRNAQYYPFGPASRWTYGNGRTLARSLNQNYLPGFVEDTRAGGLSEGYWFDAVGNLQSLQRADQSAPSKRTYDYDGLDRLTGVRDGASAALLQGYAYDKTGNRTRETEGSVVRDYAYAADTHRLVTAAGLSRQYDAAGNTTRIGPTTTAAQTTAPVASGARTKPTRSWRLDLQTRAHARRDAKHDRPRPTAPLSSRAAGEGPAVASSATKAFPPHIVRDFIYDDSGRMRQVRHDGVVAMDYRYNARGERVHRSGGGQSVTTVYDEAGRWLGDYDASGQPIQQAIWLDDLPVGLLVGAGANQTLYYLQPDALGSPRVAIDPVRDVAIWRWDLTGEAFGDSVPNEDPDGDGTAFVLDMRFPGQRHDAATGLYHNYFRDYDPTVGRYVQSDPIGLAGGISTYAYGNGAPLGFSDPLGLRGNPLGDMFGRMIARPMVERMGGGLLARAASQAAKQRADMRRAQKMLERMQGIWGRIGRGGKRGADEVPQGCEATKNSGTQNGRVALDNNALIAAIEKNQTAAVDAAIGGRTPIVSRQAAREFLWKGDKEALRRFLSERGGHIAKSGTESDVASLRALAESMGRSSKIKDIRVAASAQTERVSIITRDARFRNFLNEIGIGGESF